MIDNEINHNIEYNKTLEIVLKEMCKRVGANYNKINFKKEGWFRTYEWSEEEQNDFKKWIINYIYMNRFAREKLLAFPIRSKKLITEAVTRFLLDYGWKLNFKEEKVNDERYA